MPEEKIDLDKYSEGDRVRLIRVSNHLKQTDLAKMARVSQADLSRLERGVPVKEAVRRKILKAMDSLKTIS